MTVEPPRRFGCTALSAERSELEGARDRRAGHLGEPAYEIPFTNALNRLAEAEEQHASATGCTDLH